jgi:hypothetical protein
LATLTDENPVPTDALQSTGGPVAGHFAFQFVSVETPL